MQMKNTVEPTQASIPVLLFSCRVSLVEYLCTQGSFTHVAGMADPSVCLGPCCVTVVQEEADEADE